MTKNYQHLVQALALFFVCLLGGVSVQGAEAQYGVWNTDARAAKALALKDNRPLFLFAGPNGYCLHCDNLYNWALDTAEFKAFALTNKIVLCKGTDSTCGTSALYSEYAGANSYLSAGYTPMLYLFKVLKNDTAITNNLFSAKKGQVKLLNSEKALTDYPTQIAISVPGSVGVNVFGVIIPTETKANWTPTLMKNLVTNFFPNEYWDSVSDPGEDPEPGDDDDDDDDDDDPGETDEYYGKVLTDIAVAKAVALKDSRPLLVMVNNAGYCLHCYNWNNWAVNTPEFLTFAAKKKIVVCSPPGSAVSASSTYSEYSGVDNGYLGAGITPYMFMFRVLRNTKNTSTTAISVKAGQVQLVKGDNAVAGYPKQVAIGIPAVGGVNLFGYVFPVGESSTTWTGTMLSELVPHFFPNDVWSTIEPDDGPTGYEDAVDLGRIPNAANQPSVITGWVAGAEGNEMATGDTMNWFKFTGDQGKRYWFYLKDIVETGGTGTKVTLDFFVSTDGTKPVSKATYTMAAATLDTLNKGFSFDTPSGSVTNAVYFVRLRGTLGSGVTDLTYTLKVHETESNPSVGAVTKPVWRGTPTLGKWTMDIDSVLTTAMANNKPVLVAFSGEAWCPRCVGMELTVLGNSAVTAELNKLYCVMLDNRRRDGTGPSLLVDATTNGYLKYITTSCGATVADATAQLATNIEWQDTLSLPGSKSMDWQGGTKGKITYSTCVYCRVISDGKGGKTLEPVERLGEEYVGYPALFAANLASLKTLYDAGYTEWSQYREKTNVTLVAPSDGTPANKTVMLGSLIDGTWMKFTVRAGYTWSFTLDATSSAVTPGAEVTYKVCTSDGTEIETGKGSLEDIFAFQFASREETDTEYYLYLNTTGQLTTISSTLGYSEKELDTLLVLPQTEIGINRDAVKVTVPFSIKCYREIDEVKIQYRVVTVTGGLNKDWFGRCGWTELTVDTDDIASHKIDVTLNVPALADDWEGTKDFKVEFQTVEGGHCDVPDGTNVMVKVAALPIFFPRPEDTNYALYKGFYSEINFPVIPCTGKMVVDDVELNLPAGMTLVNNLATANPRLTIQGTPTSVTSKTLDSILYISKDGSTSSDQINFTIKVSSVNHPGSDLKGFAGFVYGSDKSYPGASILVTSTKTGGRAITVTTPTGVETTSVPSAWTGYNAEANTLILDASFTSGSTLSVSVDAALGIHATYTDSKSNVLKGDLGKMTSKPTKVDGRYNAAIRLPSDVVGRAEGWVSFNIASDGTATAAIKHYEGKASVSDYKTCVTEDADGLQYINMYMPFKMGGDDAYFFGVLEIIPEDNPIRVAAGTTVYSWISDCDGDVKLIVPTDSSLNTTYRACGTIFDPTRTITSCVQDDIVFVTEKPAVSAAVVADAVAMTENPKFTLKAKNAGVINSLLKTMTVTNEGMFTLPMTLLKRTAGTTATTPISITVSGIMVPTTADCCRADTNVAVGYGIFTYGGMDFRVRFYAQTKTGYTQTTAPEVTLTAAAGDGRTYECESANGTLLAFQEKDSTAIGITTKTDSLKVTGSKSYSFTAFATGSKAAYESTVVPVGKAASLQFTTDPGNTSAGVIRVNLGWNLIGIPQTMMVPTEAAFVHSDKSELKAFDYNTEAKTYVGASDLTAGNAYWLYVGSKETFFLYGEEASGTPQPVVLPSSWTPLAVPSNADEGDAMYFKNNKWINRAKGEVLPATQGVWIKAK